MTVHKAKGLEFPVVVLADPTVAHTGKPSRHLDPERGLCAVPLAGCIPAELREHEAEVMERDRAESVRLTYVASTRARDLLVVPVIGDHRLDGWVDVLHPALYPTAERQRQALAAEGCPPFGNDSLVTRPPRGQRGLEDCVAPGQHAPERGDHRVVWWDPHALALGQEDQRGLRQQEILKKDEAGDEGNASIRAHTEWQRRRSEITEAGARPTLVARTVTEHTREIEVVNGAPVTIERVEAGRFTRPHGRRFGTLVHAVLAEIPLDAHGPTIERTAVVQGRYLGCPAPEVTAAAQVVAEALAHPLLRRAAGASECRRELPLGLRLDDGSVLDGVVDLAFAEDGGWTVVDFKTDVGVEGNRAVYEEQVRLYARAIAAATAKPARAVLLYV
jgi:ATP-dependent exoDNAse (exonuclease V) beta subunit